MSYHSEYYLTYTAEDAAADKADGLPSVRFPQAPVAPRFDASTALHILGEINQGLDIQRREDRGPWQDQAIRKETLDSWTAWIERKRAILLAAGYRTKLSARTGYYVPDGNGHGWKYAGQD